VWARPFEQPPAPPGKRPAAATLAVLATACALLYLAGGWLGLKLAFVGSSIALVWLPSGIAVGALLRWGPSMAAGVFAGALGILVITHAHPPWSAVLIAAGATLGPMLGAALARRHGLDARFLRERDFALLLVAAVAGMLISASVGVASLWAVGAVPDARVAQAWLGWFVGDALGVMLAAPLLASMPRVPRDRWLPALRRSAAPVAVTGALLGAAVLLASLREGPAEPASMATMFALLLAVVHAAVRFGVSGTWATLVAASVVAAGLTAAGVGPFVRPDPQQGPWVAWMFLTCAALLAMVIVGARQRHVAAQHELETRQLQLRALFDQANAGMVMARDGRLAMANAAFCRMLGWRRAELLGRAALDLVHPDDRALHARFAHPTGDVSAGPAQAFEARYLHRDGHPVWVRVAWSFVQGASGAAPWLVGVVMDISDRKRLEADALRQAEQLALVYEASRGGLYDHDLVTGTSHLSPSYLRMFGYAPGTDPGSWESRLHPDDRARVLAMSRRMLERGIPFEAEYRLRRADGTYMWVHGIGDATHDAQGRATRNFGTLTDIGERKRAEAALVDSRLRFRAILESAMDAIVAFDGGGRVVLFNPAAEAMLGARAVDVVGRSWLALVPPRLRRGALAHVEGIATRVADAARAGRPVRHETVYGRRADGSEIPLDATVSRVELDGGRLYTLVLRDARERRRFEQAERARAEAEAASRAKTEFLSRMSHELRTPLNAVLGFAQLLQRDPAEPLTELQQERVGAIREAGMHLGALIDELLDLTLIEADRLRLDCVDVDLGGLVRQSLKLVMPTASAAGIAVQMPDGDGDDGAPLSVHADPIRVRQVLVNLLGNAVKYNREGGALRVRTGRDGAQAAWVEVQDDGPGIPAGQQHRLFEPFDRLGREHGGIEGTGIGLALSRRLIELMGGRIEVRSEPGRGTVFTVRLPMPQGTPSGPEATPGAPMDAPSAPAPGRPPARGDAAVSTQARA